MNEQVTEALIGQQVRCISTTGFADNTVREGEVYPITGADPCDNTVKVALGTWGGLDGIPSTYGIANYRLIV